MVDALVAGMMTLSLLLMYTSGRMKGREERASWRMEEIAQALEIGRRNGLAYCKTEYHPLIEKAAADKCGSTHAAMAMEWTHRGYQNGLRQGVERGRADCAAGHQRRAEGGRFAPKPNNPKARRKK